MSACGMSSPACSLPWHHDVASCEPMASRDTRTTDSQLVLVLVSAAFVASSASCVHGPVNVHSGLAQAAACARSAGAWAACPANCTAVGMACGAGVRVQSDAQVCFAFRPCIHKQRCGAAIEQDGSHAAVPSISFRLNHVELFE